MPTFQMNSTHKQTAKFGVMLPITLQVEDLSFTAVGIYLYLATRNVDTFEAQSLIVNDINTLADILSALDELVTVDLVNLVKPA